MKSDLSNGRHLPHDGDMITFARRVNLCLLLKCK